MSYLCRMAKKIRLLSDETINQIAAGEVIESPASVVKELVENALDAAATKIEIEITGGGLKRIVIQDDGIGMGEEDALLSIQRHATSKIRTPHDLFQITTKGFRGEALASIASISKMTLTTAQENGPGTQLEIEGGTLLKNKRCGRTHGTTFEISSLFYNVPARKKFQKSPAALSAEIYRMVTLMSLSHPEVSFTLRSNGKVSLQVRKQDLKGRAEEILGSEFVQGSFPLHFEEGPFLFEGLIGSPLQSRPNRLGQYLFLNRRAVSCPPIEEAIREGYATRLEEKRYPLFYLHLSVPTDLVDVNVHPQKLTVRLRKEELFREKLTKAVSLALTPKREAPKISSTPFTRPEKISEELPFVLEETPSFEEQTLKLEEEIEVVGLYRHFLLINEGKLLVVNLEAASFRVAFEELRGRESSGEREGLLIPFTVPVTTVEAAMLLTHGEAVERLGFSLRPIEKDVFLVEATPPGITQEEVHTLLTSFGQGLQEFIGKTDYENKRAEMLALTTASLMKKRAFSKPEAIALFKELKKTSDPLHCPKGSPTMVHIDDESIEDFFRKDQNLAKGAAR